MKPVCRILEYCALAIALILVTACSGSNLLSRDSHAEQIGAGRRFEWIPPTQQTANLLGTVRIHLASQPIDLRVLPETTTPDLRLGTSTCTASIPPLRCTVSWQSQGVTATITLQVQQSDRALTVDVQADKPFFSALHVTWWPANSKPQLLTVPYYSGLIAHLSAPGVFGNAYFDWTRSNATLLNAFPPPRSAPPLLADRAAYLPRTDGTLNPLRERLVVEVSENVQDVLPVISNAPSPYIKDLAGRTVVDIWGGTFQEVLNGLLLLQTHGLNHCVAIIHMWQRHGYDNGLPAHYPAEESLGGPLLKQVVETGKEAGCLVGLHENYVDYYPNYDHFDPHAIALKSDKKPDLAWLNSGTGIQSFATKPTEMLGLASTQSPLIHKTYGTNADYLDVNSSVFPWLRVDMDAKAAGAGTFSAFRDATDRLFAYERETHSGPVFGEGLNHWLWSGSLDGVEAALGAGVPRNSGAGVPLFVDFDLLRIHPLQVNHGMGYYSTWLAKDQTMEDAASTDAYRMQEVAFGHAPFVTSTYWNSPARVLLEQGLVSPVAGRYGTQTINSIQYHVNGKWETSNEAAGANRFSQVRITYNNGDTIIANGEKQSFLSDKIDLPLWGWVAKGDGLLAYTATRNGQIVDYAETTDSIFANARNQSDWVQSGAIATLTAGTFQQTGPRAFNVTTAGTILEGLPNGHPRLFLHFLSGLSGPSADKIVFAADQPLAVPAAQWKPGQSIASRSLLVRIPDSVPDGTYYMVGGLYEPEGGIRYQLAGHDTGNRRYLLGVLTVSNSGQTIRFVSEPRLALSPPDPRLNVKGMVVDFGVLQTDGMVSVIRTGSKWRAWVYPSYRNVIVRLAGARFAVPENVSCDSVPDKVQHPRLQDGYWQIETAGANYCSW